jgi:predicted RNase H-like HicB family nuclease
MSSESWLSRMRTSITRKFRRCRTAIHGGYTYEEALKNIKEAAELCLETMAEDGEPIPEEDFETLRQAPITLGLMV